MKKYNIKVNIAKPQKMDKLIERYSRTAAKIISRKIPYNSLNILIDRLNNKKEENN